MDPVPRETQKRRELQAHAQQRDRQAPPRNTRQGAAPMVGASHKSRSLVESCRFSVGTTPRTCGEDFKTQIEKNDVRITIASELPNLSQKPGRLARGKIEGADKAFYGRKCRSAPLWASGSGGGAFVGKSYNRQAHTFPRHGKLFAEFSTVWKLFYAIFPQYGKLFSTPWKTS